MASFFLHRIFCCKTKKSVHWPQPPPPQKLPVKLGTCALGDSIELGQEILLKKYYVELKTQPTYFHVI